MQRHVLRLIGCLIVVMLLLGIFAMGAGAMPAASTPGVTWTDNFDGDDYSDLNPRWRWVHEEPYFWNLSDGWLHIQTDSLSTMENILLTDVPPGDFNITVKVSFQPNSQSRLAGIILYGDDTHYLELGIGNLYSGGDGIYFGRRENNGYVGGIMMGSYTHEVAIIKLSRQGDLYKGYYMDSDVWAHLGDHSIDWTPTGLGLIAVNHTISLDSVIANFDYVTVEDYTHYIYLPLIRK